MALPTHHPEYPEHIKRLIALLTVLLLLSCTTALAATSATTKMPLATRTGPGTRHSVVTYVCADQWYEILRSTVGSTDKVWYYICVDGEYGWISSGITNMER